jgi:hypothetical protein
MGSIVALFVLDSGWASKVREFGEEAVNRCAASDGLHAWDLSWLFGPGQTTM